MRLCLLQLCALKPTLKERGRGGGLTARKSGASQKNFSMYRSIKLNLPWKEIAIKAPAVTAATLAVILVFSKILDRDLPPWIYIVVAAFILFFSSFVIYLHFNKKKAATVVIKDQVLEKINTDGGDFSVGAKGGTVDSLAIDNVKVKDVKTGGGDFIVGIKDK